MSTDTPKALKAISAVRYLDGKRWTIKYVQPVDLDKEEEGEQIGACEPNRQIKVALGMSDFDTLETWIHECLHATDPDFEEDAIIKRAKFIAKVLWWAGFRHEHLSNSKN